MKIAIAVSPSRRTPRRAASQPTAVPASITNAPSAKTSAKKRACGFQIAVAGAHIVATARMKAAAAPTAGTSHLGRRSRATAERISQTMITNTACIGSRLATGAAPSHVFVVSARSVMTMAATSAPRAHIHGSGRGGSQITTETAPAAANRQPVSLQIQRVGGGGGVAPTAPQAAATAALTRSGS